MDLKEYRWPLFGGVMVLASAGLFSIGRGQPNILALGTGFLISGLVVLYFTYRGWYCESCGQFLGRGSKPSGCDRCGSNRVTTSDPMQD